MENKLFKVAAQELVIPMSYLQHKSSQLLVFFAIERSKNYSSAKTLKKKSNSTNSTTVVIVKEFDNGKMVGTVMFDFSAAFNVVDHKVLRSKLKGKGFIMAVHPVVKMLNEGSLKEVF